MKLTELESQVSVSDQINSAEVGNLVESGVEVVVCNRPDREVAEQPAFDEIARACQQLGIEALHLPFVGDAVEDAQVRQFVELIQSGRKIHAYCRSGARSSKLWAQARSRLGMAPEEILSRAGQAGVDVSKHVHTPHSQV